MNNNNRNGKEVHKGQRPDDIQKEGKPRPVNRIKKKHTSAARDITSVEPKKIPLNINKNPVNPSKGDQKGHVIKLKEKESSIHPVEASFNENQRTPPRTTVSNDRNTRSADSIPYQSKNDDFKAPPGESKDGYKLSVNTGKLLLIAAAVFFIAWAVVFFYYKIGGNSHMLLALSVICAIVALVGKRNR